jgi:hypothetical protein
MLGKQEIRAVNISIPYNIIYPVSFLFFFFNRWIALQLYLLSLCNDKEVNFDKRATQKERKTNASMQTRQSGVESLKRIKRWSMVFQLDLLVFPFNILAFLATSFVLITSGYL